MIVIHAPYPYPEHVRDGWMRRIQVVDEILSERERVYVWPVGVRWRADAQDYRITEEDVAPRTRYFRMDLRFSNHVRRLAELVDQAELVYGHTSHSSQFLLPFYRTGKIVTDLHGLAPEEETMQGKPGRAAFFAALEEPMVRQSARIVVVTESMAEHFQAKYPGLATPHVLLPIVDDIAPVERRASGRALHVVYSGGAQAWQCVGRMLSAVARAPRDMRFSFYTRDVAEMRVLAQAAGVAERIGFETLDRAALMAAYATADLGFVVRADSPVNRVSCPTKLSEYLATGVVPIVDLVEIGDFARMGYRYVTLADFEAGRLPSAAELDAMRRANRAVFERLRGTFAAGIETLRGLELGGASRGASRGTGPLDMTSIERNTIYPFLEAYVEVTRDDGTHYLSLEDIAAPRVDVELPLPGVGPLKALRLVLGRQPLLVTPIEVLVRTASGTDVRLELDSQPRVDAHGNWCIPRFEDAVPALGVDVASPLGLRIRFEVLLAGHEVLGVLRPEPASFLSHLRGLRRLGVQRLRYVYGRWRRRGQRPTRAADTGAVEPSNRGW